ncbi:RNA-binding protein MEX3B [Schistocerca nitens]|uniref:RNA-binding protein MEX3B n=1 Tax=Schistocerca nitens TaxID=7011 RepID=UPI002117E489|nr:RNA-binding protein MEX3B [Schistocerca nitens]
MTECVPVPSSEHVAEIVGRQGCKIKALRAKTNTYIKTPVRGEEPVFVVTGRKEDVAKAKREILSAAEHFSQIRASRKSNLGGGGGGSGSAPPGPPAAVPGHVTIQVRVPYRVVGLVVGPKGATIKRIQHQTHTYIVTPSRDKEPVFEVTGLPDSVETARREIEAHIAMRTGGAAGAAVGVGGGVGGGHGALAGVGGVSVGSLVDDSPDLLASLYKSGLGSLFNYLDGGADASGLGGFHGPANGIGGGGIGVGGGAGISVGGGGVLPGGSASSVGSSSSSGAFSSCSSSSSSSSGGGGGRLGDLVSIWGSSAGSVGGSAGGGSTGSVGGSGSGGGSLERDEGLGDSPSFETAPTSIWSYGTTGLAGRPSPATSVSPDSAGAGNGGQVLPPVTSTTGGGVGAIVSTAVTTATGGGGGQSGRRDCVVCAEREVDAALVPCGHNLFCLDCASHVCERGDALCPACQLPVAQAIRIFS